ncbi:MAG: PAS domain S-box protein [Candidatus Dormibacteria bacterium]
MHVVLVAAAAGEDDAVLARLRGDRVSHRLTVVADAQALACAVTAGCDVVLCDDRQRRFGARAVLRLCAELAPNLPVVVVSSASGDDSIAELLSMGAADYVFRDRMAALSPAVVRAVRECREAAERRRRDQHTDALLATSFAGFYRSLPTGRIVHANRALHRMFGYETLEEFLAVDLASLYLCPEQRQRIVDAARAGQDTHELETQMRRRDGTLFWVSMTVRSVREAGELVEFTGVLIDVTERREAAERLSRRVERQEALLELSQVAVGIRGSSELFQAAASAAARMMSAPLATVADLDLEHNTLGLRATSGLFWDGVSQAPYGAPAWALDGRRRVAALEDASNLDQPLPDILVRHHVRSYVSVPIVAGDRPLGVLSVQDTVARHWDLEEIESLQIAADMLAVALERRRSAKERQSLFAQLVHAQEEERRTIAGEIHDDAVQVMAATNIRLELLRRKLSDPKQVHAARGLQETIEASIGRLRSLLFNLTPPDMESYGLSAAVRAQLEQLGLDENVRWTLEEGELGGEPEEAVRIVLFRICQEALINIRKHARARQVTVRLFRHEGGYAASIQDDGDGFDPAAAKRRPGHIGLVSMRERAASAGGWWRLTSSPGNGTMVETWLPERAAS